MLEESDDPAWKNLGAVARSVSEMRLARLCFAPSGGQQIDVRGWTTVFTLGGLTLPDTTTSREDYSYEQRLSVALLYLPAVAPRLSMTAAVNVTVPVGVGVAPLMVKMLLSVVVALRPLVRVTDRPGCEIPNPFTVHV